jgi:endoglucanase
VKTGVRLIALIAAGCVAIGTAGGTPGRAVAPRGAPRAVASLAALQARAPISAAATTPVAHPAVRRPLRSAAAASPAGRLIAEWPFNESVGRVARDVDGRHSARLFGAVTVGRAGRGPDDRSYAFSGSGRVVGPPMRGITGVLAWVRAAPSRGGRVLDAGDLRLSVRSGRLVARVCSKSCAVLTGASIDDGAWHQAGVEVADGHAALFVDGVMAAVRHVGRYRPRRARVHVGKGFVGGIDDVQLYAGTLPPRRVAARFISGACPQSAGPQPPASVARTLPALPLHTSGRFVVEASGQRVKLAGVNWDGAEQFDRVPAGLQCRTADGIASEIAAAGYTVVRLPWATATWLGADPRVPPIAVAADPSLRGLGAREVFDRVVDALGRYGLLVVLDNHVTRPGWCCSDSDGNGLWWSGFDPAHPPAWEKMSPAARLTYYRQGASDWLAAWSRVAARYAAGGVDPQPAVVGADLRNEPRGDQQLGITPSWGSSAPWSNWSLAATVAGHVVLHANPQLLVIVEGLDYASDLRGAAVVPLQQAFPGRLVYSVHEYPFFVRGAVSASDLASSMGAQWGWLLAQGTPYTAPVWVGEFGVCQLGQPSCPAAGHDGQWLAAFAAYLRAGDVDWAYWSVNGTEARGEPVPLTCDQTPRLPGCANGYGLLTATWSGDGSPLVSAALRSLQAATQE